MMKSKSDNDLAVLIIGFGGFGHALAQGIKMTYTNVLHVSARSFLAKSVDEIAVDFSTVQCIMYCGKCLTQHSKKLASAMIISSRIRSSSLFAPSEFIDFSNPDPSSDRTEDVKGAAALAAELALANETNSSTSSPAPCCNIIWKVTGVSNLDVAGHEGRCNAIVYGSGTLQTGQIPTIRIPWITWNQANDPSLLREVYDRLMDRAEVDQWHDACALCLAIFSFTFGYAFTRYSELVNGGYGWTMVPLYISDKALCWAGLWMFLVSPFAGNLLALGATSKNWSVTSSVNDKIVFLISIPIAAFAVLLFIFPWIAWIIIRKIFFCGRGFGPGSKKSVIKQSLVDMISMKHQTGVIGFFLSFAHGFAGSIIATPAYKGKWFMENERFYGNNEASLACGMVALSILTAVMIRSLFGKDSWMKLRPMYSFAAPIGLWLATFHVVFMGYKGWNKLFDYSVKKGQPSITFVSSMFPICVLSVNLFLVVFGTKKASSNYIIWKHTCTNAAYLNFMKIQNSLKINKNGSDTTCVGTSLRISDLDV